MSSSKDQRVEFVKRLNQACDRMDPDIVPRLMAGRQTKIAERVGVSNEAVNKWFNGVAIPRAPAMKRLAKLLQVEEAWLALGINSQLIRRNRLIDGRTSDGAAQLVFGMMTLAGISCGELVRNAKESSEVDFYALMGSGLKAISVTLAREVKPAGTYDFSIISDYQDVRIIGVVSLGNDEFHFLELDADHIDKFKTGDAPLVGITVKRNESEKSYQTRDYTWPRIQTFSDLLTQ